MPIEKAAFVDWRENGVTQAFKKDLTQAIEQLVTSLVNAVGSTHEYDQLLRGWIRGMSEALEWEPDFVEEQDD